MSDPAPTIIQLSQPSVVEWIKTALTQTTIPPVNTVHLNGYSGRKDIEEALASLAGAHKVGGAKAAQTAWNEQVSKFIPDVATIVNRPRRIFHSSELKNIPPMRWLIEGEIPEFGFTVIYGPSGVGKSFLALDYSERIGQRRPVLYIMGEGRSGYKARHEAWLKHNKLNDNKLFFFDGTVLFNNRNETEGFIEEAREYSPQLIVVDTLARCFDGDENSARDVGEFIRGCDRVRNELHCAVIVIHHTSKAGSTERGSGALRGAADVMIEVVDNEENIKVICSKVKDGREFDPRVLKLLTVDLEPGITSCVIVPSNLVKSNPDQLTENQRSIMELLISPLYVDSGARATDIKSSTNIQGGSYSRAINSLLERNLVMKDGRYDPIRVTANGHSLARRLGLTRHA